MEKRSLFVVVIITSLVMASCQAVALSPTMQTVETADQSQFTEQALILTEQAVTIASFNTLVASTSTPAAIEIEITPEATELPVYDGEVTVIDSNGLVLTLPLEVAEGAIVETILPDDPDEGWPEFALPARRAISFSGYSIQSHFHTPVIYIYPLEKMIQAGLYGGSVAVNLQALLEDPGFDLTVEGSLPFLPPFNAAQVFHVLEKRLDSDQNSGIRFLTLYSQAYVGIDNYDLFYTYQGISANGSYYIAAVLPINSSLLSNEELAQLELETIAGDYEAYITSKKDLLIIDNGLSLTPTLAALDAMMTSIICQN